MLRLVEDAMVSRARPRFRWPLLTGVALGACLLVGLPIGNWRMFDRPSAIDATTAIGERRTLALADGSQVELNTDTRIDAKLNGRERRIILGHGEALFEVAHDSARPFLVIAGDVVVRATGTRFDVRRDSAQTSVQLFEGGVDIAESGRPAVHLRPGQRWLSGERAPQAIQHVDARQTLAWRQGRIVFDATPLGQAIAEINRYTPRKVTLFAERRPGAPISGSFTTGDPSGFVKAVSAMLDLEAERSADGSFMLRDTSATPGVGADKKDASARFEAC